MPERIVESDRVVLNALIERETALPRPARERALVAARNGVNAALSTDISVVSANALAEVASAPARDLTQAMAEEALNIPNERRSIQIPTEQIDE